MHYILVTFEFLVLRVGMGFGVAMEGTSYLVKMLVPFLPLARTSEHNGVTALWGIQS